VLRAQVRLTELLQEQLRWRAAVESAEGALAALLDLSPDVELPRTDELATDAPAPALEPLLHRLEEQSPLLAALAARIEEAASRRGAEVLAGYPDFDVGVGYRIRANVPGDPVEGDDFVFAGVKLRLPLDRGKWRARGAEQARRHHLRTARQARKRRRIELDEEPNAAAVLNHKARRDPLQLATCNRERPRRRPKLGRWPCCDFGARDLASRDPVLKPQRIGDLAKRVDVQGSEATGHHADQRCGVAKLGKRQDDRVKPFVPPVVGVKVASWLGVQSRGRRLLEKRIVWAHLVGRRACGGRRDEDEPFHRGVPAEKMTSNPSGEKAIWAPVTVL